MIGNLISPSAKQEGSHKINVSSVVPQFPGEKQISVQPCTTHARSLTECEKPETEAAQTDRQTDRQTDTHTLISLMNPLDLFAGNNILSNEC